MGIVMNKPQILLTLAAAMVVSGAASAQYPMVDAVANRIIQKYQTATCQQLWQEKAQGKKPPGEMEQNAIQFLRNDAGARAEFFSKISAPIVSKMFECGMIP
jgi:hypothetical protein